MTMRDIVRKLEEQGHSVNYYVRKDGGILIKRIDGEIFTSGASGNVRARKLVGATLSEARSAQLKYATRVRSRKRISLDDEIEREFERVKKKWNKAFKASKGKPHKAGYFGKARIEYSLKTLGKKETLRRIKEAERYAEGKAYSKNIEYLATLIENAGKQYNSKALEKLAKDLRANAYLIEEDWIKPAYDELYKLNVGMSPADVARNVRMILRLARNESKNK